MVEQIVFLCTKETVDKLVPRLSSKSKFVFWSEKEKNRLKYFSRMCYSQKDWHTCAHCSIKEEKELSGTFKYFFSTVHLTRPLSKSFSFVQSFSKLWLCAFIIFHLRVLEWVFIISLFYFIFYSCGCLLKQYLSLIIIGNRSLCCLGAEQLLMYLFGHNATISDTTTVCVWIYVFPDSLHKLLHMAQIPCFNPREQIHTACSCSLTDRAHWDCTPSSVLSPN